MKKIAAIICLGLAIFFAMGTIGCIDTDPAVSCFGAVCTVLLFLAWMKLRKKKKAATPTKAAPAKPSPAATTVKTAALAKPAKTPAPALTVPAKNISIKPTVSAQPNTVLQETPSTPRNHASGLPKLPGHSVKYTYDDVHIACSDRYFPIVDLQFDDLLTFKQEPENPYDDKAVAIYRGEDQLGYLYRNRMQDMVNDWIVKGKPVYGLYEDGIGEESFTIYFFS